MKTLLLMASPGRAVVATRDIPARTIVEISPILIMPSEDLDALKATFLNQYT
jgi:hypothetical protein